VEVGGARAWEEISFLVNANFGGERKQVNWRGSVTMAEEAHFFLGVVLWGRSNTFEKRKVAS